MAGHMGTRQVTKLNLRVVETDVEKGVILVHGHVPGFAGNYVRVRDAVKKPAPKETAPEGAVKLPTQSTTSAPDAVAKE
jgi:large subunit ribosomal protein L3